MKQYVYDVTFSATFISLRVREEDETLYFASWAVCGNLPAEIATVAMVNVYFHKLLV